MKKFSPLMLLGLVAALLSGCTSDAKPDTEEPGGGGSCPPSAPSLCPATTSFPQGYCADIQQDTQNCGSCGNHCPDGLACSNGQCACPGGKTLCQGVCVDLQSDPQNCGMCAQDCGGLFCNVGSCSATCSQTTCASGAGQVCVDPTSSPDHCGECGNACGAGQACTGGSCTCPGGAAACNGMCCSAGATCDGTQCVAVTPGGGGNANGGAGNGDNAGAGGMSGGANNDNGGASNGGATDNNGGDPPGYWRYGDWKGCVWTGVDVEDVGTTATPEDFRDRAPTDAYCLSGTVGADEDYASVALLGFNLNEDPAGADCAYDPTDATAKGPPGVTLTAEGIAADFVKQGADTSFVLRVQLQGPDGATDENDRWCATIDAVQGKVFVPYSDFNTACWDGTGDAYAGQPVSAVVFLVPGSQEPTPYDFCVNGFAAGTSASDAPDGPAQAGDLTGRVGSDGAEGDFERAKVVADGEEYIIQNNNWGNPDSTNLILEYKNNSFKVVEGRGEGGNGQGVPSSFPSIYIGANGFTQNGVLATSGTDNLPKQVSQINSIQTTFEWSGTTDSFNATYDVWFANSPPATEYKDGIDGFLMVWLHDPADAQPIGGQTRSANIAGTSWQVWTGERGPGPDGYNDAPVVSYVANQSMNALTFDLKDFIDDAVQNNNLSGSMYLTDVFAGFEIWRGGAGGNLGVDKFTCKVE